MYTSAVVVGAIGLSYAAVPLYRTPKVGTGRFEPERLIPADDARRIKVTFNADKSDQLPWSFKPQQKHVYVLPGESSLAFYTATNKSKEDIIGIATYNVTPDRVAPYFSKVECFCFEEQKLLAGEEVDMPLLFFIDKDILDDPSCVNVNDVVLSYTFFRARRNKQGHLEPDASEEVVRDSLGFAPCLTRRRDALSFFVLLCASSQREVVKIVGGNAVFQPAFKAAESYLFKFYTTLDLVGMEVFVTNIDPMASRHDVIRAIASELHRSDSLYSPRGLLPNFDFRPFMKGKRHHALHAGRGTLTLTKPVGEAFLRYQGYPQTSSIRVNGKPLMFKLSERNGSPVTADPGVLQRITASDYMDPERAEDRDRRSSVLSTTSITISSLQFCWECRDDVLSNEWEKSLMGSLSFSYDSRRIIIQTSISHPSYLVIMDYSQITLISAANSALFFRLSTPPLFEKVKKTVTLNGSDYKRIPCLPIESSTGRPHSEVSQYTSLALRVQGSTEHIRRFKMLAQTAEMPVTIEEDFYIMESRGLFSARSLKSFYDWTNTLDFGTAYQLRSLVQQQSVDPVEMKALSSAVQKVVNKASERGLDGPDFLRRTFVEFGERAFDLFWTEEKKQSLLDCFVEATQSAEFSPPLSRRTDDGLFLCYHVYITPTSILLDGPLPERSNVIIRRVPPEKRSNFIRVSFVDEGKLRLQHSQDFKIETYIEDRVAPFLRKGLHLNNRQYHFLAYSQSALKEHTAWFMAPFTDPSGNFASVEHVITSMGSFDVPEDPQLIFCPARFAARVSQGFTTTDPTTTPVGEFRILKDIKTRDQNLNVWTHTDGAGTMSPEFAQKIQFDRLPARNRTPERLAQYPRVLQVRVMGSKGVISVDHRLRGLVVCLRPSMTKFRGAQTDKIEIAKFFDKPGKLYLNRPLIMLLEGLGIPFRTFKRFQDMAVHAAYESKKNLKEAASFLEANGLGMSFRISSVLNSLVKLDVSSLSGDLLAFFDNMMSDAIHHVLRVLKHKARIPIPSGWNLPGICDVYSELGRNEIFICIDNGDGEQPIFVQGPVAIWRSPVIHPGDIQIVNAIGKPRRGSAYSVDPLANSVVMNVKAIDRRPLSTKLGGGDVDGDEYQVIPLTTYPEFNFTPRSPGSYAPAERKMVNHKCGVSDIANFFKNYITTDSIGMIATRWLEIADQSTETIFDKKCLQLANLHSLAVDYPKTGTPVPIFDIPSANSKMLPDWKAPETMYELDGSRYYPSQSAIGKLSRAIDLQGAQSVVKRKQLSHQRTAIAVKPLQNYIQALAVAPPYLEYLLVCMPSDLNSGIHSTQHYDEPTYTLHVRERVAPLFLSSPPLSQSVISTLKDDIPSIFLHYRGTLHGICSAQTLSSNRKSTLTEEEAVVGTIMAKTSQPRKRLDHIHKLRDGTDRLVTATRSSILGDGQPNREELLDGLQRAYLAWELSLKVMKDGIFGARSFGFVALGAIFEAIRDIEDFWDREAKNFEKETNADLLQSLDDFHI
ncbi:RNA-directed RNA polymerase 2 [Flagelloscypha sp. PMI_526]|nr:RNA-directed RNA polymerase 2 [Flagelloscypha sp. PMI_526]